MTHPVSVCFICGHEDKVMNGQPDTELMCNIYFLQQWRYQSREIKGFRVCPREQPALGEIIPQIPVGSRSESHQWLIWHD